MTTKAGRPGGSGEWRGVGRYPAERKAGETLEISPASAPAALATAGAQNGRSSSSASSASGKSSNDSLPLGAAAAAPAATLLGAEYEDSDPSERPESMISSRAVISVVYRVWPSRSCHDRYSMLPSMYTLSPFLQYFS